LEPTTADVAGGCTAGTPIAIAAGTRAVAIASTSDGALLAYDGYVHVVVQRLGFDGAPIDAPIYVPGSGRRLGLARLGDGVVLVQMLRTGEHGQGLSLVVTPLEATGQPTGASASQYTGTTDDADVMLYPASNGATVWFVAAIDAHAWNGLLVSRIARDDGGLTVDRVHHYGGTLGRGAHLAGCRVSATDDDLVVLYDQRLDGSTHAPAQTARYVIRYAANTWGHLDDVDDLIHDLVLADGEAYVAFDRGADQLTAHLDTSSGHIDQVTVLDRTAPYAPPFGSRVLVASAHETTVLHDASGRRLGEALPSGAIAWTGHGFLVAGGDGAVTVTPVACTPAAVH
jgi:hypothetical protein